MLNRQKVLITGGTKGIGFEVAKLFLDNYFEVYVLGRDFSNFDLEKAKKIEFDLTDLRNIPTLIEETGEIDILINNAGIMNAIPMDDYPNEKKELLMKVNLEAPIELIKLYSKGMIEKGEGRIVNTASIAGEIGHPDIWYGISKAGIINLTKSLAKSLGPKGIVTNCVAPGPVDTDMLSTIPEERKEGLKKASINNRFADPREVAETIYWLGSESPRYINGICIDINNGTFMR